MATGGCSYPLTGSTGDGYGLARSAGHTVTELRGSLVPLEEDGGWCAKLQGLSLRNCAIQAKNAAGKALYKDFGELLFTHFGLSGPVILSASAHGKPGELKEIVIDLKPALDEQKLDQRMLRDLEQYQNRTIDHALQDLYPRLLIPGDGGAGGDFAGDPGQFHNPDPAAAAPGADQGLLRRHPGPETRGRGHRHRGRRGRPGGPSPRPWSRSWSRASILPEKSWMWTPTPAALTCKSPGPPAAPPESPPQKKRES